MVLLATVLFNDISFDHYEVQINVFFLGKKNDLNILWKNTLINIITAHFEKYGDNIVHSWISELYTIIQKIFKYFKNKSDNIHMLLFQTVIIPVTNNEFYDSG